MHGSVSVTEAARLKNVTRQAIYLAIRLKRLKAYRHNDKWRVFLIDLKEYDQKRFSRVYHSMVNGQPVFDEEKGYFSVEKASQLISVPKQQLYYAIRTKKLKAIRRKSAWVVYAPDLFEYQNFISKKDLSKNTA